MKFEKCKEKIGMATATSIEPALPKIGQFPECGQYRLIVRAFFQSVAHGRAIAVV